MAEKIPIKYISAIEDKRFREHVIYESYKPINLRQMQDYMHFVLLFRATQSHGENQRQLFGEDKPAAAEEGEKHATGLRGSATATAEEIMRNPEVSQEIKNYYNTEAQAKLPEQLGTISQVESLLDQQKILVFDSNFESGNLDRVSIASLNEYNLFLNPDTNTKGHSQWFYFAVTNTEKGRTVTFSVLNCTKPVGLFEDGMRPVAYSELEHEISGTEWLANTCEVSYTRNEIPKNPPHDDVPPAAFYYTLTFSYTFQHTADRVYFAYSRPYSAATCCALLRSIRQTLISKARNVTVLDEDGLQKRIKEFVVAGAASKLSSEKKKASSVFEEDQLRRLERRRAAPPPEQSFVAREVLNQYKESEREPRFCWTRGTEFQAETDQFVYRQETLCHTFSGFPVQVVTVTALSSRGHPLRRRKVVFITARVHAAEVTGSFKVEGILTFLTSTPTSKREIVRLGSAGGGAEGNVRVQGGADAQP